MRLRYREVASIDPVIDELLRTEMRPVASAPARASHPVDVSPPSWAFRRAEIVDELDLDGRVALLRSTPTGGQVHVLAGIGPAIWAAAQARTLDEIVAAVVAEHGAPADGDARSIVEAAVRKLVDDGLLQAASTQT